MQDGTAGLDLIVTDTFSVNSSRMKSITGFSVIVNHDRIIPTSRVSLLIESPSTSVLWYLSPAKAFPKMAENFTRKTSSAVDQRLGNTEISQNTYTVPRTPACVQYVKAAKRRIIPTMGVRG
jgi:hypothetical protein